jgi:hypothetical protein
LFDATVILLQLVIEIRVRTMLDMTPLFIHVTRVRGYVEMRTILSSFPRIEILSSFPVEYVSQGGITQQW